MERYRVYSRPRAEQWEAYREWLTAHAAEVVLLGGFAGAEVAENQAEMVSDYLATSVPRLERYVAEAAPALRAEAERLYPDVGRSRDQLRVTQRVSAAFDWESLGLVDGEGRAVPAPADGLMELAYVAPWCGDCTTALPGLLDALRPGGERSLLVGVYGSVGELAPWLRGQAGSVPWAIEPSAKDDTHRRRTFHAFLRQLAADERSWGLPVRYRLRVMNGRFVVCWP